MCEPYRHLRVRPGRRRAAQRHVWPTLGHLHPWTIKGPHRRWLTGGWMKGFFQTRVAKLILLNCHSKRRGMRIFRRKFRNIQRADFSRIAEYWHLSPEIFVAHAWRRSCRLEYFLTIPQIYFETLEMFVLEIWRTPRCLFDGKIIVRSNIFNS